jgi:hypothetical protein
LFEPTARIQTISPWQASGALRSAYRELSRHAPRIGYVVRIFSLRPSLVRLVSSFFIDVLGSGLLPRIDKELLCVVTSYVGRCQY